MTLLDRLRGGLIVSVQARTGCALDDPRVLAAMAQAAQENGAAGVRIQGVRNLQAVRKRVGIPIVGIIKREYDGFEPYITPTVREVREVLECGAEIVAFDATGRARPQGREIGELVAAIHGGGALAMADCALAGDGVCAQAAGADILATTLCGYTKETRGTELPALDLVRAFAQLGCFVICEGGIHAPAAGAAALDAGADAVVVGTAITNTEWLVREYAAALGQPKSSPA
ncbi:MAG TPA: N-acetylmannosamine-6-phosphate 2-epimerase [Candidatus Baltobacteraceae bacterium]|nr:N-acetylmannosamine-6-phosphate 2-epimerase [Candidatus Baltobacteraceae bacterium]